MNIKKIVIRAAIIISVLLLLFKGFLMYRNYASYQDVIHENADHIIKVKVDGLIQTIVFNAISNPSFYNRTSTEKDSLKTDKKTGKGFSIPANLFVYTIKNKPSTTFFTSLKLTDSSNFTNHLMSDFKIENFETSKGITIATTNDHNFLIAFNDKQCVMAYNPSKENINEVFSELLIDNKTLSKSDEKWSKIKDANSHINYVTKNNNLHLDFNSGNISITGNLELPVFLNVPRTYTGVQFSKDASATLNLNVFSTLQYVSFDFEGTEIKVDSLNDYYNGHIALEIAQTTTQIDSIISYTYNDDFEKVETKSAVKKEVPEINVQLSSKGSKLYKYLERASIIKQGMLNKELFPLYQFKIDTTTTSLLASTNIHKPEVFIETENTNVLELNIDFKKLKQQNHFPMLNSYLEQLLTLKTIGTFNKDETLQIEGKVQFANKDINALVQLVMENLE
ncbi:hypothetical protein [Olleya aquimaris]|uniref:Uncharacterized protein n=1 Tax=Olleya aquimaris TaxID=639310 RepID=A0A327RMR9_9FLAO|nr:hypothetical protein [Olleya aquimaris]RAJ17781.1 hypothetical protein LY08_00049 [Olleya aquimaris]